MRGSAELLVLGVPLQYRFVQPAAVLPQEAIRKILDCLGLPTRPPPIASARPHMDESQPVLENVNFRLEPGERVALVGANGHGKTTIVKLMTRLYDVTSGQILLDDQGTGAVRALFLPRVPHGLDQIIRVLHRDIVLLG
jgi:ABC-type multidrug transport system fused ATPase/permease subunit